MKHTVQSSTIKVIEETGRGTMIVEFKDGKKHEYFDVPLVVIQDFVNSPSIGRFFNESIRGKYREEKRS